MRLNVKAILLGALTCYVVEFAVAALFVLPILGSAITAMVKAGPHHAKSDISPDLVHTVQSPGFAIWLIVAVAAGYFTGGYVAGKLAARDQEAYALMAAGTVLIFTLIQERRPRSTAHHFHFHQSIAITVFEYVLIPVSAYCGGRYARHARRRKEKSVGEQSLIPPPIPLP